MLGAVLGGIAGLLTGGTAMAAAVGAGLGRLASGGDLEDALKDGALAFGIGSIPGVGNFAKNAMGTWWCHSQGSHSKNDGRRSCYGSVQGI